VNAARAIAPALLAVALAFASGAAPAQSGADYFSVVDTDGDGRVSLPEFLERMSWAFRKMDANRDDVLEPSEQLVPNAKRITLAEHHARFADQFRRQDRDRDGSLDRREYLSPPQR
jgi:Ca2+-binding EF-hand superfamily protein